MSKSRSSRTGSFSRRTSWNPVAEWYAGWTGSGGSDHHRALAIPAVLEMLPIAQRLQILEVGCGHGVLARPLVEAGCVYTGIDLSPKLIRLARRHHGRAGRFLEGDACDLASTTPLKAQSFDAVVFMLSIQDMEPLTSVLNSAAWALKPGGCIVILMVHPCFRVPRQSGWGWDAQRKLQFRRVDRYLTPLSVPMREYMGPIEGSTWSFHRPLSAYINALAGAGLLLDQMREIPTYKISQNGRNAKAENAANQEIPLFLGLRGYKQSK